VIYRIVKTIILDQKILHYGRFTRPTQLVIYYGRAAAYNTPYVGVQTRGFANMAALATTAVASQASFDKIYFERARTWAGSVRGLSEVRPVRVMGGGQVDRRHVFLLNAFDHEDPHRFRR
jgi:hypothetical protein